MVATGRSTVIIDQAVLDWEGWNDPVGAARGTVRWKLLVDGERDPSGGLVTGVAEIAPGGVLPRHRHEPEETYYVLSGRGEIEIEDAVTEIGPGTAVFIPPDARHALHCIGDAVVAWLVPDTHAPAAPAGWRPEPAGARNRFARDPPGPAFLAHGPRGVARGRLLRGMEPFGPPGGRRHPPDE